jgi:hypothetical protein
MNERGYCASCKHNAHPGHDCAECGCTRYKDRRIASETRQRVWTVQADFFVRNRWIRSSDIRVKAMAVAGASLKALREAKRVTLKPRTRVAQTRLTLTPVPQRGRERP